MAKVVAVAAGKGGVGKTTTAVNVAALLGSEGRRVLLVDADPQGPGSAASWISDSYVAFDLVKDSSPAMLAKVGRAKDYDIVIVDTPPRIESSIIKAVSRASDVVIVTAPPETEELLAGIETVKAFGLLKSRMLMTMVDSRTIDRARQAQDSLREVHIAVFAAPVRLYSAHRRAREQHLPIKAVGGRGSIAASMDYTLVVAELVVLLDGTR